MTCSQFEIHHKTERSEAVYASPLVLVKKPDGTYRTCVNFKDKITVFDPELPKMHRFLYGQHFVFRLQYLNSANSKSPRLMRWSLALQPYHFTIRYIRGEENFCADYLSGGCAAEAEQTFC